MDIKLKTPQTGYEQFEAGDTIENAEEIFGVAQARYLVEQGHADVVGKGAAATEQAIADQNANETADIKAKPGKPEKPA